MCNGSIAGDRLEVMSSGSRPSTSDSDASARGLNLKQAARAQKLNKLSGLYGGSAGGGLSCRTCAYACSSNVSARGNSAPGVGAGSGLGARDAMNGPRDASSARDRRSAGGGSAGPASGRHHMPPNVNMLRIPTELRSSSENERAFRRGGGGGSAANQGQDTVGACVAAALRPLAPTSALRHNGRQNGFMEITAWIFSSFSGRAAAASARPGWTCGGREPPVYDVESSISTL